MATDGSPGRRGGDGRPRQGRVLRRGLILLGAVVTLFPGLPRVSGVGGEEPTAHSPGAEAATPLPPVQVVVGPDGDFATLAAALAGAPEGSVVRVRAGVYREGTLTVDRRLHLLGEGFPVLDGEGSHSILVVTADSVTVEGFLFQGAGVSHVRDHAAITVEGAEGCLIRQNRFRDNFFGIYLAKASGCRVQDNDLIASGLRETSSGNGIHLWDTHRVLVERNRVRGHRDGIYLEFARGAVIRENQVEENLRYGLHFMFSDDSFYQGNTFQRNGAGVAVMYSRNVTMAGNRFLDNWGPVSYGLLVKDVQDSLIEANLFRGNTVAIHSEGSDRLVFRLNRLERNGWAVRILANSQDNLFTANNFIENTFDVVTNSRQSFNTFDGNHWSAYRGYDLGGDGTGDVPHRPVRLFSYVVERKPAAMILLRSFFVDILEVAERVLPVLAPEALVDENPRMTEIPS